jgi:hypothetical protein
MSTHYARPCSKAFYAFIQSYGIGLLFSPILQMGNVNCREVTCSKVTGFTNGGRVKIWLRHSGHKAYNLTTALLYCVTVGAGLVLYIYPGVRNCIMMFRLGVPLFHPKKLKLDLLIIYFIIYKVFSYT